MHSLASLLDTSTIGSSSSDENAKNNISEIFKIFYQTIKLMLLLL